ncbi:hypothetical protein Tco_1265738 [Tanacetum coccineum]
MQKTILKQQYENFAASRSEGLDKTYDRFQKLIRPNGNSWQVALTKGEEIHIEDRKESNFNGKENKLLALISQSYQAEKRPTILSQLMVHSIFRFIQSSIQIVSVNNKIGVGFDSQMNENELHDSHKSKVFESASDSSVNESEEDNNQVNDRYKAGVGYHAVPPPYTGNFMPPIPDMFLC